MKIWESNTVFKIVSLLLAILLWLYVSNEHSPLDQVTREVALEMRNLPQNLAVGEAPARVSVKIEGSRNMLEDLTPADIDAYVDLTGARAGEAEEVVAVTLPAGVKAIKVSPAKVRLNFDTLADKNIPVTVGIKGTAASGFTVLEPVLRPSAVIVKGPRGLLDRITRAEARYTMQNQAQSFMANLPVQVLTEEGKVVDARLIQVIPASVEVYFPVVRDLPSKTVPVEPVTTGSPAKGYRVISVVAVPADLQVFGPEAQINKLTVVRTQPVDIAGRTGDVVQDAVVELPAGFYMPPYTRVKVIVKVGR